MHVSVHVLLRCGRMAGHVVWRGLRSGRCTGLGPRRRYWPRTGLRLWTPNRWRGPYALHQLLLYRRVLLLLQLLLLWRRGTHYVPPSLHLLLLLHRKLGIKLLLLALLRIAPWSTTTAH